MTTPTPRQLEELTAIIKSGGTMTISLQDGEIQVVIASDKGIAIASDDEFYYALEGALHALEHALHKLGNKEQDDE